MGLGTRAGTIAAPMDVPAVVVIVAAHNEADRIELTLAALAGAFPGARVLVADDASTDDTAARASAAGAEVVTAPRNIGKGGANTLAARRVLSLALTPEAPVFVLCDGDLGETAGRLPALVAAVRRGECDLAVASFSRRVGGGFGFAVGYARAAIRRLTGLELDAPISGQRALSAGVLPVVVPFAPRFGMEIGMTVDAARAGFRVAEVELDLAHRATGRSVAGFAHRARQLRDFVLTELSRR
jgi:glycosyltransferase involved in cell wall biosynthesis